MATFIKTVVSTDIQTGESRIHGQVSIEAQSRPTDFSFFNDGFEFYTTFQTPEEVDLDSSELDDPSFSREDMEGF